MRSEGLLLSTKGTRITMTMLCQTLDSLCLHPHYSRLLLLQNLSKEEIKRHLLADRYY